MLTTSMNKAARLVAALAAATALASGVAVAAGFGPTGQSFRAGVIDRAAQPPGERPCGDANDPHCTVEDHRPEEDRPGPPGNPDHRSDGGACTFDNGDGTVTVSDADRGRDTVSVVLVAQTGVVEVPCYLNDQWGWYHSGNSCYYGEFPPVRVASQGIPEPPEGQTEEDGRWYYKRCLIEVIGELPHQEYITWTFEQWEWVEAADVPVVTPTMVAQDWLARIRLDRPEIRLAPPETGAGLVGLPVWLGLEQTETSSGLIDDSHCMGDVCVSIDAIVTEVEWDVGDGTVFTCSPEQHVVWHSGLDFRAPGGNCHHYYQRTSRHQPGRQYEITATSLWQVSWSRDAAGDSGTLTPQRRATANLRIDEIQVLTSR